VFAKYSKRTITHSKIIQSNCHDMQIDFIKHAIVLNNSHLK